MIVAINAHPRSAQAQLTMLSQTFHYVLAQQGLRFQSIFESSQLWQFTNDVVVLNLSFRSLMHKIVLLIDNNYLITYSKLMIGLLAY